MQFWNLSQLSLLCKQFSIILLINSEKWIKNLVSFWTHQLHGWRRKGRRREEEEEEEEEEGEEQRYVFLYEIKCILMSKVIGVIARVFLWRLVAPFLGFCGEITLTLEFLNFYG